MKLLTVVLGLLAVTALPGQVEQPTVSVGYSYERLPNPLQKEARKIPIGIVYRKRAPRDAAILPRQGGYPVVMILHGYAGRAGAMYPMANRFVQRGYLVVCTDGGRIDPNRQASDAGALLTALNKFTQDKESDFFGQLDMTRVGICGHSMGGGNAVRVLAQHGGKGLRAGFCFAPWDGQIGGIGKKNYVTEHAPKVKLPVGIVHGTGDRILPWKRTGLAFYDAMKDRGAAETWLYLLNKDCDHLNVALPFGRAGRDNNRQVFNFCSDLAIAFFDKHLLGRDEALTTLLSKNNKRRVKLYRNEVKKKTKVRKRGIR